MSTPLTHTAYFDSSALVKRYLTETGTTWVQTWCDDPGKTIAVAEIGLVEIAAAFAAKLRGSFISPEIYRNVRTDLTIDARDEYVLVAVNRSLVDEAIELTAQYRLRGYDAIHLACALRIHHALTAHHLTPLTFVCADNDLLTAATAAGLSIDNPNQHP